MEDTANHSHDSVKDMLRKLNDQSLLETFPALAKPTKWLTALRESDLLDQVLYIVLLSQESRNSGIQQGESIANWRLRRWKGLVDEAFIAQRQRFEKVSYYHLNVAERGLAMELYFQLCNGETDFETLLKEYMPTKPGKPQKGIIKLKPIQSLPSGLVKKLKKSRPGLTLEPMVIGNAVSLVQLIEWHPPVLDEMTREMLQKEVEEQWLEKELHRRLQLATPNDQGVEPPKALPMTGEEG